MIPHSRPTLGDAELAAVEEVVRSGQLALGPKVGQFERRFARAIGMPDAVAVNSGTSGLHLALCALGIGPGDEVLMPSYVCSALLYAVSYVGAVPVVVDSLPDHVHMNAEAAMEKISKKTKAVILVHLFGDVTGTKEWRGSGLRIIEDGTQSLGNKGPDGVVGSLGDLSVFSFYATKMMTTGEGGMIGVRDPGLARTLRDTREYDEKKGFRARYNYKMTDLAAAMGLAQLAQLPSFIDRRRQIASQYNHVLRARSSVPKPCNQDDSIYYRYVLASGQDVEEWMSHFTSKGIACKRPVFEPLHRVGRLADEQFPCATLHYRQNISLPIYPSLTEAEIETISAALTNMDLRRVEVP